MKKSLIILFMLLDSLSNHAESVYYGFAELTLEESFTYRFVKAKDAESQQAIEDLLAGQDETEDQSIIKRAYDEWYVRKGCPLPEGNYYESAFYRKNDGDYFIILPKIEVIMNNDVPIDELLGLLGNRVKLMSNEANAYYLSCQVKTSEEVLELCLLIYGCAYDYGILGVKRFKADWYRLSPVSDNYLINRLKGSNQSYVPKNDGEVLIYEMNWEGVKVDGIIWEFEKPDWDYVGTDEGFAITNPTMKELIWEPQVMIIPDAFPLEAGHDYIVRLTLKVPSDGAYQVNMGTWPTNSQYQVPVTASDEWQEIDVDFPKFGWNEGTLYAWDADSRKDLERCHVLLQCGWMIGTTVVKKVQVIEKAKGGETYIKPTKPNKSDGAIYNLAGQKVSTSYKGFVIKNGKKFLQK